MPRSQAIENAVAAQMERVEKDADGNYLCRRCGGVVPDEFKFMVHLPDDEDHVWGPYCCEDCIVYAKICSGCNRDFDVEDQSQIKYFGDGSWLCTECAEDIIHCTECNRITTEDALNDLGSGRKVCSVCKEHKYFKDLIDNKWYPNADRAWERINNITKARYPGTNFKKIHRKNLEKAIEGIAPVPVGECKRCQRVAPEGTMTDGYCEGCYDYTFKCAECGETNHRGTSTGTVGKVCKKCINLFFKCSICNRYHKKTEKCTTVNGFKTYTVCQSCKDDNHVECTFCLSLVKEDRLKIRTDSDGNTLRVCDHCDSSGNWNSTEKEYIFQEYARRSEMDSIMSYSYTPEPLVFNHGGVKQDRVFFGFENEMNYSSSSRYSRSMKNIYKYYKASQLYLKSDSSINGSGFECVSHPMNLSYFRKFPLVQLFKEEPKKDDQSCGLHVHVSRTSFVSDVHIFKVVRFINDGDDFIKLIAGRDYNGFAHKISSKLSSHVKNKGGDKYNAVNLSPSQTIEIRIFRGAKTEYQLRYRIEFVHALVTYTRTSSLSDKDEKNFVAWVLKRKNQYPSLHRFLKAEYNG